MHFSCRIPCCSSLCLALALMACEASELPSDILLPGGVPVASLSKVQQELLRVTLAVDDGILAEAALVLTGDRLSGDLPLSNARGGGEHAAHLRIYGRAAPDSGEVLLGQLDTRLVVNAAGQTRLAFAAADTFVTCAARADGSCAPAFDANRNGASNLIDLLPTDQEGRGIDPAPQGPFVVVAPSTLPFPSGIRLGEFARQVIVVENTGDHPLVIERIDVVGAPGLGVSLFEEVLSDELSNENTTRRAPRRRLDASAFAAPLLPTEEAFVAVTFAPSNTFLTTGAVHVTVRDTVTQVRQTARARIIANPEGELRTVPADQLEPSAFAGSNFAGVDAPVHGYPLASLLSGLPITGDDPESEQTGLARVAGSIDVPLSEALGGGIRTIAADVGFLIEVLPGHRLAASLAGLRSDVDLALLTLLAGDAIGTAACADCLAGAAGASPEGLDYLNDSDTIARLLLVLGRVDLDTAAEPGRVPFELSCLTTRSPAFLDDEPVLPATGALEGGQPVVLRGRGFDARATVTFAGLPALDVVITEVAGISEVSLTTPPGSLAVGRNPATIVVANPAVADGGDGQAATLPEAFVYQPPAPRISDVSPAIASTGNNTIPVTIIGAFFSNRFGPPQVRFGALDVDSVFIDAARIKVVPPSGQDEGSVVLTVRNRLSQETGDLGAGSDARAFTFFTPLGGAPTLTGVSPATASTDGGDLLTISGDDFRAGAQAFLGGVACIVSAIDNDGLDCVAGALLSAGPVDVLVVNIDGTSGQLRDGVTYQQPAPRVDSFFPTSVSSLGGALLVVDGAGFRTGARVRFRQGGTTVTAASVSVASTGSCLVAMPALPAGAWLVEVENTDGLSAQRAGLTSTAAVGAAPLIEAVEPATTSSSGGAPISLLARDLQANARVTVGTAVISAQDTTVVLGVAGGFDRIDFTAPSAVQAGAGLLGGLVRVQVLNEDGQAATALLTYVQDVAAAPRIEDVAPARISGTRTQVVTVRAVGVRAGFAVLLGSQPIPSNETSSGVIECSIPPRARGPVPLTVMNLDGSSASVLLDIAGPPVIAGLSTTTIHASVPGDRVFVFGDALDVDPLVLVTLQADGESKPANVVQSANGFLVIEMPAVSAQGDIPLTLQWLGQTPTSAPTIDARDPMIIVALSSKERRPDGTLTVLFFGDALNPERLSQVRLEPDQLEDGEVLCLIDEASENTAVCTTTTVPPPSVSYRAIFDYQGAFAGESVPLSIPLVFFDGTPTAFDTGPLTIASYSRTLPANVDLSGIEVELNVPGATLAASPGDLRLVLTIDEQSSAGSPSGKFVFCPATVIADGLVRATLEFGSLEAGAYGAELVTTGENVFRGTTYAVSGATTLAVVGLQLSAPVVDWPAGFSVTGGLSAGETISAVLVNNPSVTHVLATAGPNDVNGQQVLPVTSTGPLPAGNWNICVGAAFCSGPTLTVIGAASELEPNDDESSATAYRRGVGGVDGQFDDISAAALDDSRADVWMYHAQQGEFLNIEVVVNGGLCDGMRPRVLLAQAPGRVVQAQFDAPLGGCTAGGGFLVPQSGELHVFIEATGAGAQPYRLNLEFATQTLLCGDGIVSAGESCDDTNAFPGDGCENCLLVDANTVCLGSPSQCAATLVFADSFDNGPNGWGQEGVSGKWQQAADGTGDTAWQLIPNSLAQTDTMLLSPIIDLTRLALNTPLFVRWRHRDVDLSPGVSVVMHAGGTIPSPIQNPVSEPLLLVSPIGGYPTPEGWGPTAHSGFVEEVIDLTRFAGGTLQLGFRGAAAEGSTATWFLDDIVVAARVN